MNGYESYSWKELFNFSLGSSSPSVVTKRLKLNTPTSSKWGWPSQVRIVMLMGARLIIDLSKSSNSSVLAQNGPAQVAYTFLRWKLGGKFKIHNFFKKSGSE